MSSLYDLLRQRFGTDKNVALYGASQATDKFGYTTFSEPLRVDAAVRIEDKKYIPILLSLANQHGFSVYPISTGKNWGYGLINAKDTKQKVVLDLSGMNSIRIVDKELGLVTLEPGVTQGMLADYLRNHNLLFMTPTTGAGPHCSIVSNALETGYGITPYTDHFDAVTALKGFLPHPELCHQEYESAISALDGSDNDLIDKTYKWGIGPYLDGLFVQSNLAVVTEATIRLAPQPESFVAFYIKAGDDTALDELVTFIQNTLRDFAGIIGSINLMDKRRLMSMSADNPNGKSAHKAMTDEQVDELAQQNQTPEWMIIGTIYGVKSVTQAVKAHIKRNANNLGQMIFSDGKLMQFARSISNRFPVGPLEGVKNQLRMLDRAGEIMQGIPNQVALPLAYWRNPRINDLESRTLTPSHDQCGLLWYAPLIHMNHGSIQVFVAMVREIAPKYGIEPLITFTNLKHDCIDATVPIVFDNANIESRQLALQCLDELVKAGLTQGFVPYRMNVDQQQALLSDEAPFWQAALKVKQSLDPNQILSPGRYIPLQKQ